MSIAPSKRIAGVVETALRGKNGLWRRVDACLIAVRESFEEEIR
jgi:hypothetical protein